MSLCLGKGVALTLYRVQVTRLARPSLVTRRDAETNGEAMSEETKAPHKVAEDSDAAWDMQDMQTGKPHGWLQWKGTDVCMDVYCVCGNHTHIDGDFTYHVKCGVCGRVYFCNGHIEFIELKKEPEHCLVQSEYHGDRIFDKPGAAREPQRTRRRTGAECAPQTKEMR